MASQHGFQRMAALCGVVAVLLFFGAFALAGFIPPVSPSLTAEQITAHYREHTFGMGLGGLAMMLSGMFYAPFTAVISTQMQRIPGVHRTVHYTRLVAGAFACVTFTLPGMLLVVASFRPERAPDLTLLLNDLAWILLVLPWPPFFAQNGAFAFAIMTDRREVPLFPRWVAYFNVWAPISFSPSILLPFFRSGPFAWNGLFVVWIPAVVFVAQFVVNAAVLFTAIRQEESLEVGLPGFDGLGAPVAVVPPSMISGT
ncbi:hypothetical protein LQ327_14380 [Actinomycetospora endophytica]|uniref:Uncharacterized protein n=1 Tax=Actinomycetospora endophytica TaxID=2291215 RepID=A0ABS8P8J1_9PSEU|nr:hypothetical protein [Actinomycetospora endophytica]MCD2194556.1 hypothetical protein [Actinomycetospora endophytica]